MIPDPHHPGAWICPSRPDSTSWGLGTFSTVLVVAVPVATISIACLARKCWCRRAAAARGAKLAEVLGGDRLDEPGHEYHKLPADHGGRRHGVARPHTRGRRQQQAGTVGDGDGTLEPRVAVARASAPTAVPMAPPLAAEAAAPMAVVAAPLAAPMAPPSLVEQLQQLAELARAGDLTQEEYATAKREVLSGAKRAGGGGDGDEA